MNLSGVKVGATRRRGTAIAAAALTMAMVAPIIHPIVNPNQAAVAQAQTAASDTIVEAGTTVYSNTQQYRGYAYIDRAGAVPNGQGQGDSNVNADDQPLAGLSVYLQWRDQSGFVSPVLHAVTDANGQYYFDLSQTFYDARGGAHKFRLSGLNDTPYNGSYTRVRTWSDNPDVNRYTPVIVGDMYANGTFHGRTDRKQESWNFTSGVDVIENGKMAFQE